MIVDCAAGHGAMWGVCGFVMVGKKKKRRGFWTWSTKLCFNSVGTFLDSVVRQERVLFPVLNGGFPHPSGRTTWGNTRLAFPTHSTGLLKWAGSLFSFQPKLDSYSSARSIILGHVSYHRYPEADLTLMFCSGFPGLRVRGPDT